MPKEVGGINRNVWLTNYFTLADGLAMGMWNYAILGILPAGGPEPSMLTAQISSCVRRPDGWGQRSCLVALSSGRT